MGPAKVEVLLVYPPHHGQTKNPPLGLAYIASVLEREGFGVEIQDMNIMHGEIADFLKKVKEIQPKIVGISFMTPQVKIAGQIAEGVKAVAPSAWVVVGGPHVSAVPQEVLQQRPIDFAVIGEGEMTMLDLARVLLRTGGDFDDIHGLAFRRDGEVVLTTPRPPIMDLDSLPFPAWHLLPVDKYSVRGYGGDLSKPTFAILSSRGCPYQCIFCDSHTVFGRKFRGRSAENILSEIIYLRDKYGATQFDMVDDTITINKERLARLCQMVIERGLNIQWMANARVNAVDYDLLRLMRDAGCVRIDFGVESGDPGVLKTIKKGITIDQARRAHRWTKKLGIRTSSFFMVGNPGESWSSVKQTLQLAKELKSDFPSVGIATPYPGAELYHMAKTRGWILIDDWSKYTPSAYTEKKFQPVMRTDTMSGDDIVKAYYFLNSRFLMNKYKARYGRCFWLNPIFYRHTIFAGRNVSDLIHLPRVVLKLVCSLLVPHLPNSRRNK